MDWKKKIRIIWICLLVASLVTIAGMNIQMEKGIQYFEYPVFDEAGTSKKMTSFNRGDQSSRKKFKSGRKGSKNILNEL
jgi:hypothetical protein